ncbi:MAG: hypothetical protein MHPSP_001814, partial [Paramarteilia canceri]
IRLKRNLKKSAPDLLMTEASKKHISSDAAMQTTYFQYENQQKELTFDSSASTSGKLLKILGDLFGSERMKKRPEEFTLVVSDTERNYYFLKNKDYFGKYTDFKNYKVEVHESTKQFSIRIGTKQTFAPVKTSETITELLKKVCKLEGINPNEMTLGYFKSLRTTDENKINDISQKDDKFQYGKTEIEYFPHPQKTMLEQNIALETEAMSLILFQIAFSSNIGFESNSLIQIDLAFFHYRNEICSQLSKYFTPMSLEDLLNLCYYSRIVDVADQTNKPFNIEDHINGNYLANYKKKESTIAKQVNQMIDEIEILDLPMIQTAKISYLNILNFTQPYFKYSKFECIARTITMSNNRNSIYDYTKNEMDSTHPTHIILIDKSSMWIYEIPTKTKEKWEPIIRSSLKQVIFKSINVGMLNLTIKDDKNKTETVMKIIKIDSYRLKTTFNAYVTVNEPEKPKV